MFDSNYADDLICTPARLGWIIFTLGCMLGAVLGAAGTILMKGI